MCINTKRMKKIQKSIIRVLLLTVFSGVLGLSIPTQLSANLQEQDVFEEFTDDYTPGETSSCATCSTAKSCEAGAGTTAPPWLKYGFWFLITVGAAIYLKKKI